jgi:hypothetical protein
VSLCSMSLLITILLNVTLQNVILLNVTVLSVFRMSRISQAKSWVFKFSVLASGLVKFDHMT